MSKSLNEQRIREIIDEELEKKITKYYPKEPLTREEFLKAIEAMNKRFEASDKRMNELMEAMNERFEASDKRMNELIETMNKRFEVSDKRMEELIDSMNTRFEKVFEGQMVLKVAIDSLG